MRLSTSPDRIPSGSSTWHANLKAWLVVLVSVGVAWRLVRYFLKFPIWGDEAFVCLNFVHQDYLGLLGHLRYHQVVPLLYLWMELTTYQWLGDSELVMRLPSLAAGLVSIVLFWRLCRRVLSPLACTLAVGILAVSYFPVRHSCEVKPYAFDLLCPLLLLLPAVCWLQEPGRLRYLILLALLTPLAVMASYPTVFVAGAVTIVLIPTVYRHADWRARSLFELYNLLLVTSFALHFLIVGKTQVGVQGGEVQTFYHKYWEHCFPPSRVLDWPGWLLNIHTGDLFAYPSGGGHFGSTFTTLLCVAGIVHCWRQRHWALLSLCLLPFAFNLGAAFLDRYPYGGVTRLCQHLAPAICLLAGAGGGALLEATAQTPRLQWRATWIAGCALIAVAIVGMARDVRHPYKTADEEWDRQVADNLARDARQGIPLVVMNKPNVKPTLLWYLYRHKSAFQWQDEADWKALAENSGEIWCYHHTLAPIPPEQYPLFQPRSSGPWTLTHHERHTSQPDYDDDPIEHWEIFHWKKGSREE